MVGRLDPVDINMLMPFKIAVKNINRACSVYNLRRAAQLSTSIRANTRWAGFSGKLGFGVISIYNFTYRLCMLIFSDLYFSSVF